MVEDKNKKGLGRGLMSLFGDQEKTKINEDNSQEKTGSKNTYLLVY